MKALRIIARIIGTAAAAWWSASLIASTINGYGTLLTLEAVMMVFLVIGNISGTIIAWFREREGGVVLGCFSVSLSVFAYFSAGHNNWFAVLVSGFPFLVAAVLFLVIGYKKTKS